jgi:hypothetical protein
MNKSSLWKVVLYVLALFAAGAVTGAMVMHPKAEPQQLKLNRSAEIATNIRERLTTRLHLTPEQAAKFAPLVMKTSEELESSHRDCLKRIVAALDALHAQLAPDLTPDQLEALKQLESERRDVMFKKYEFSPDDKKPARGPN